MKNLRRWLVQVRLMQHQDMQMYCMHKRFCPPGLLIALFWKTWSSLSLTLNMTKRLSFVRRWITSHFNPFFFKFVGFLFFSLIITLSWLIFVYILYCSFIWQKPLMFAVKVLEDKENQAACWCLHQLVMSKMENGLN